MVIVMQGISGSGKSTWIQNSLPEALVVSADHFFMVPEGYVFDPAKLPLAHADCLRKFAVCVQDSMGDPRPIVVDNTNTSIAEMAPYCALALAYGHQLKVVSVLCNPFQAAKRTAHGTPLKAVLAQHRRLLRTLDEMPPWWPQEVVEAV